MTYIDWHMLGLLALIVAGLSWSYWLSWVTYKARTPLKPRQVSPAERAFGVPTGGFIRRGKLLRMIKDKEQRALMEASLGHCDCLGAVVYRTTHDEGYAIKAVYSDSGWQRASEWSDLFYATRIYEKPWGKKK
jgi:hypothetical protein